MLNNHSSITQDYIARGWSIHRVKPHSKKPGYREWENTTHEPKQFKDSDNVGGKLGSKSGNRVAIDLDCHEAIALGPQYLEDTAVSGKGSKESHYVYGSAIPEKLEFYDIPEITIEDGKKKAKKKIIEVLTNGQQMLLPPSVADGETYSWKNNLEPKEVDPDTLLHQVRMLATAVIVARNIPEEGEGRHDVSNALAGFLLKRMSEDDTVDILEPAWELEGSKDGVNGLKNNINSTVKKITDKERATGGRRLEELIPGLARAISKVWGWSYNSKTDAATQDELRDRVLDSHKLAATGLGWRKYQDGVWTEQHESQIRALVQDTIEDSGATLTNGLVTAVTSLVRDRCYVGAGRWDANGDIVVCRDHVLDLNTGTTREHSPEDYATSKLPFNYDPKARAPHWKRFLQDRFPDKATRVLLQDYAGYAHTTDNSLETAVWFIGGPGTGKSTLIETLEHVMGDRAGTFKLQNLQSPFGLTKIPGKTLLTATEQPSEYVKGLDTLNAMISGETLEIEAKYQRGEDYRPVCKLLWAMNDLPTVRAPENGIWRRIKIVEFPPLNSPPDRGLKAKLRDEAPGILTWAVRGLMRLRERGQFEIPESVESATNEYRAENDLELQFIEERCNRDLFDNSLSTTSEHLYAAYRRWCERFGYKAKNQQNVAKEWKRLGLEKFRSNGMRWRYVEIEKLGRDVRGSDGRYADEESRYEDGTFYARD